MSARKGIWVPTLLLLTLALFSSTIVIYLDTINYREQLDKSVRESSWNSFQSKVELFRLERTALLCIFGSGCDPQELFIRAEIFASRLLILIEGTELRNNGSFVGARPEIISAYERTVQLLLKCERADRSAPIASSCLAADILPIVEGVSAPLRQLLQATTLQNQAMEQREDALLVVSPTVPFLLLGGAGAGLVSILFVQLRARERTLKELEALREEERRLQADTQSLVTTLPVPVCVLVPGSEVVFSNDAAQRLFGTHLSDALQTVSKVTERGNVNVDKQLISLPISEGQMHTFRLQCTGMLWSGRLAHVCVLQDTVLDGDAHLTAMGTGKMVLLGELSSAIVHELNQPLATISVAALNLRSLLETSGPNAAVVAKVQKIQDQVDRISRIVSNVRKLASSVEPLEPFVPRSAVDAALQTTAYQLELASISVEVEDSISSSSYVLGNNFLLELCVMNMLLNARDAFSAGGRNERRQVGIKLAEDANFITVEVSDNAGGIEENILERIFDSFVTSKLCEGGMGVGLAISRRAVESMRGTISAENRNGGAAFTIRLPMLRKV